MMHTYGDQRQGKKSQSAAREAERGQIASRDAFHFSDNRPESKQFQKLQDVANESPRSHQLRAFQEVVSRHSTRQEPIQRMRNIIQLKLREEDSKFVMDFLRMNFTGDEADFVLREGEILRIHHEITETASSRHQGILMAMRAVRKLYKSKEVEAGQVSDEVEEHGYDGKGGVDFTIEQYDKLDDLVRAYNVILGGGDITRGMDSVETSRIGEAYGALVKYVESEDLNDMLDLITCPGSSKATKKYEGRTFMQIMKQARSGVDCHNAYADALTECLYTLNRY